MAIFNGKLARRRLYAPNPCRSSLARQAAASTSLTKLSISTASHFMSEICFVGIP